MHRGSTASKGLLPLSIALVVVTAVAGAVLAPAASSTALSEDGAGFEAVASPAIVPAPVTGTAAWLKGQGVPGVYGRSNNRAGVWGSSNQGWGGYFSSSNGYGIRVATTGTDHWDHGAFIEAESGYAIYATSSGNMAIRGESGNITGLWQPVGNVGVVGIGASRGLYGSAGSSYGVYGTSLNWYGVYGRTSKPDNNYGLYTPDNLFASNLSSSGSSSLVVQNAGQVSLEPGDVAVFVGLGEPFGAEGHRYVQVAHADAAPSAAIAGVVQGEYNSGLLRLQEPDAEALVALETSEHSFGNAAPKREEPWVTRARPAPPGEFLLLVTHGPAEVKASTVMEGPIQPSDVLVAERGTALAVRAASRNGAGEEVAAPPRAIGSALTALAAGHETVWVFVRPN